MMHELLTAVGILTALFAVLALIMVIADNTIADYGDVTVDINDGQKILTVEGGRPLLQSLMGEKIFIPSACGGRGSCGFCKVKVLDGAGDFLPTELPWLTEAEKKENIRLSCQVKVKKNMKIQVPEELFNVKQYDSVVASIRDLTYDIKEVRMRLLDPSVIDFRPGQFVQFQVPEYELCDESVYRAYSVASSPSEKDMIELEIRLVPNGICTTFVHNYLKEGDKVTLNGPYGDFFLRDTDRDIIFIAGGSGMAPIKSILLDMAEKKNPRQAVYCFGARSGRDLFLVDEMKTMEKKIPNFSFVPCLSEPKPEDNWTGETGLITVAVDKYCTDPANTEAYLCGSPGMIAACVDVLHKKGVTDDRIFYDKFA